MTDLTDKCRDMAPRVAEIMGINYIPKENVPRDDEKPGFFPRHTTTPPTLSQCLDFLRGRVDYGFTVHFSKPSGKWIIYIYTHFGTKRFESTISLEAAYSAILEVGRKPLAMSDEDLEDMYNSIEDAREAIDNDRK